MFSFGYFSGVKLSFAEVSEPSVRAIFKGWMNPLKMDLTQGSETSAKLNLTKPLKMDLTECSETSAKLNLTKPLKMDLTEGFETSAKLNLTKPLKMDLTEGSETSAKLNLTPGKYPKENIQVSEHGENLNQGYLYICIISLTQLKKIHYPV
jgi:hypothetical protein